jgi:hypothetical protein
VCSATIALYNGISKILHRFDVFLLFHVCEIKYHFPFVGWGGGKYVSASTEMLNSVTSTITDSYLQDGSENVLKLPHV